MRHLNILEHYLLEEHDVVVQYEEECSDSYYPSAGLIEINSKQSKESQLYGLLHEASHVALSHRASSTREETLTKECEAWTYGKSLAKALGIHISEEKYEKEFQKSIIRYIRYFDGEET